MSTEMQTPRVDNIDFRNLDKGYEPFAQALRSLGFDWQIGKTEDLKGFFQTPDHSAQLFFKLPAADRGQNGEETTEFSIISDLWSGVSESIAVIRKRQPGKLMKVRSMQVDGNKLTFGVS